MHLCTWQGPHPRSCRCFWSLVFDLLAVKKVSPTPTGMRRAGAAGAAILTAVAFGASSLCCRVAKTTSQGHHLLSCRRFWSASSSCPVLKMCNIIRGRHLSTMFQKSYEFDVLLSVVASGAGEWKVERALHNSRAAIRVIKVIVVAFGPARINSANCRRDGACRGRHPRSCRCCWSVVLLLPVKSPKPSAANQSYSTINTLNGLKPSPSHAVRLFARV